MLKSKRERLTEIAIKLNITDVEVENIKNI
jgi:hypothetical protein